MNQPHENSLHADFKDLLTRFTENSVEVRLFASSLFARVLRNHHSEHGKDLQELMMTRINIFIDAFNTFTEAQQFMMYLEVKGFSPTEETQDIVRGIYGRRVVVGADDHACFRRWKRLAIESLPNSVYHLQLDKKCIYTITTFGIYTIDDLIEATKSKDWPHAYSGIGRNYFNAINVALDQYAKKYNLADFNVDTAYNEFTQFIVSMNETDKHTQEIAAFTSRNYQHVYHNEFIYEARHMLMSNINLFIKAYLTLPVSQQLAIYLSHRGADQKDMAAVLGGLPHVESSFRFHPERASFEVQHGVANCVKKWRAYCVEALPDSIYKLHLDSGSLNALIKFDIYTIPRLVSAINNTDIVESIPGIGNLRARSIKNALKAYFDNAETDDQVANRVQRQISHIRLSTRGLQYAIQNKTLDAFTIVDDMIATLNALKMDLEIL